jgi:hypothetical protein
MKDIVAIVGSHARSSADFDFTRTDCDVWIFNEALSNGKFPRADATFQIHDPVIWKNPENRNDKGYSEWLKRNDIPPVYMQEDYPEVPQARQFPLDGILEMTANFNQNKFITSSPSYGIALAVYLGYKRIEIYGVEMESQTEYAYQRAGVAYWVGVAVGKGIDVYTNSRIFEEPLYGYEGRITIEQMDYEARIAELTPVVAELDQRYKDAKKDFDVLIEDVAMYGREPDRLKVAIKQFVGICNEYGYNKGMLDENQRYLQKVQNMQKIEDEKYIIVRQEYEQACAANGKMNNDAINETIVIDREMQPLFVHAMEAKNAIKRRIRLQPFIQKLNHLLVRSIHVGVYRGAADENSRYMEKLDHYIRAAGGSKSEAVMIEAGVEA